mmetsp:Transcript_18697/g.33826  ORF Transcript_18697/g.33826 Transcript_18697/m.33826 type:complete len:219 (-) Transcript_18697:269-925(-)
MLKTREVTAWLKTRYARQSKESYLLSPKERSALQEATMVFEEFDLDKSGTLDLQELAKLFQSFGLDLTKRDLSEMFAVVKPKSRSQITLEEFKRFTLSREGLDSKSQAEFRKLVDSHKHLDSTKCVTGSLSAMMAHMVHMNKVRHLVDKIGTVSSRKLSIRDDIDRFTQVFALQPKYLERRTIDTLPKTTEISQPKFEKRKFEKHIQQSIKSAQQRER